MEKKEVVKRGSTANDDNGVDVKNPDKNLSGKSDEREVKICKSRFFILYSSFFILRELSSRIAKA